MKQKVKQRNTFKKGDQCVQNPSTRKFRNQVKKNVFTHKKSETGKSELFFFHYDKC